MLCFARYEHKQRPNTGLKILPQIREIVEAPLGINKTVEPDASACVIATATAEIGVKEVGNNRGRRVGQYLSICNLPEGYAWCAAFVCWCLEQCYVESPRNAMAAVVSTKNIVYKKNKGHQLPPVQDILAFGLWYQNLNRIGHTGIITNYQGNTAITIEGNTNGSGSRDGDGVHQKIRPINTIYVISSYRKSAKVGYIPGNSGSIVQIHLSTTKRLAA